MRADALVRAIPAWRGGEPTLSGSLERAIEAAILDGRIARGMRLPSERALAAELGLSRVTVSSAYATLRADGWIETVRGAGSRACLPAGLDAQIDGGASEQESGVIDFDRAAPMAPLPAYLAALERATQRLGPHAQNPAPVRLPELRSAIAERYTRAGLPTVPEQVLVTTGAGAALMLVVRHLVAPAARALVESPTWPGALALMRAARLRLIGWPMANGWDPELFAELVRQVRPAAAYLVLDFHNPTGALATAHEREAIARACARAGTLLVIDETMRDLDLRGPDAGPVPIMPAGSRTLHLGSLAKSVWAGLGVGWLRGPTARIEELAATPESYYLTPPVLQQLTALELFDELDGLIEARRAQLEAQLAVLHELLDGLPALRLTQEPAGGLTTWTELPGGMTCSALVRRAPQYGLRLLPSGRCSPDGGTLDRFLRLPFTLTPELLRTAGGRLGELLEAERSG